MQNWMWHSKMQVCEDCTMYEDASTMMASVYAQITHANARKYDNTTVSTGENDTDDKNYYAKLLDWSRQHSSASPLIA